MISKIPGSTQVSPKNVPGAQPLMTVQKNGSRDPGRKKSVPKNGPKNAPANSPKHTPKNGPKNDPENVPENAPDDRPKKRPRKAQFSIPENFTWTNFQLKILYIIFWAVF